MKRLVLPLIILATLVSQGAQLKKAHDYDSALNYLVSNYAQDVQQKGLSKLETAERVCEVDQDVADEQLDDACLIIEHN